MNIRSMFKKDINRNINGVIKVAQNDDAVLEQELSEYVITNELNEHFETFFKNYNSTIKAPSEKIGVWISGFFGSGKSHFLKMLSYILSNKLVKNKPAIEYFTDKFENKKIWDEIIKATSIPTESILFNIDIEGPTNKDKTAVLKTFAKMFYNHCGYYGSNLKLVKFEKYLEKTGKKEKFCKQYSKECGEEWQNSRDTFAFREDEVTKALQAIGMSKVSARNWFNSEETAELSISDLVKDIKEYVDSKGENFRLLFMLDEIGQYIGSDNSLILNLQSIVEEIGSKCASKVWVMVTSQEAINNFLKRKDNNDKMVYDFSKIQGRFNTAIKMSSQSVDEVIKKRILEKKEDASQLLKEEYNAQKSTLKNLYSFVDGFAYASKFLNEADFSETYPFIPYQFKLIQDVLEETRNHGSSGKNISEGERSLLSSFKEVAQSIQDKDEKSLVPFYMFYDTFSSFLESNIRMVIDNCRKDAEREDGIDHYDICVLKLLYLLKYIQEKGSIKSNLENITILMIDNIDTDKINLKRKIEKSLSRLLDKNYIQRNGDIYSFLTQNEQDVADEIRRIQIDDAAITKNIGDKIFGEIFTAKKIRYEHKYIFDFDRFIDGTLYGSPNGEIRIRFVTEAGDLKDAEPTKIRANSKNNNEAIFVLNSKSQYYDDLTEIEKIKKYVAQNSNKTISDSKYAFILNQQQHSRTLSNLVSQRIEKAITEADIYVCGEKVNYSGSIAKNKIEQAMNQLIKNVYTELDSVNVLIERDSEIEDILQNTENTTKTFEVTGGNNKLAINKIKTYLKSQEGLSTKVTINDVYKHFTKVPYGWREIDIAAMLARLISAQQLEIIFKTGTTIDSKDPRIIDYLRKRQYFENYILKLKEKASEALIKKFQCFLNEYGLNNGQMPKENDKLAELAVSEFKDKINNCNKYLDYYKNKKYPGKDILNKAINVFTELIYQQKEPLKVIALILRKQDDLFALQKDLNKVINFFEHKKEIFDNALETYALVENNSIYFHDCLEASSSLIILCEILECEEPYNRIKDLTKHTETVKKAYFKVLEKRKSEISKSIINYRKELEEIVKNVKDSEIIIQDAIKEFEKIQNSISNQKSLDIINSQPQKLEFIKNNVINKLNKLIEEQYKQIPISESINQEPKTEISENQPTKQKNNKVGVKQTKSIEIKPSQKYKKIVSKTKTLNTTTFETKNDIDDYVENLRKKLYKELSDNTIIVFS